MQSPESILLEDFGQKVDLTRRIREVLLNYPEGTTVLKELIQNADDAGATKVIFCLDRRRHCSDSLLSNSLSEWQGHALLAYNDAVFTEEDFVSISRIGGSAKHGQAWKTGRFGVGFNSVYHLTDLPSFVSGKYVVLFDPQGIYLPNVSTSNPGKRIDFVSSSAISHYNDQFSPYVSFGCDMRSLFRGTLFRFPLRNVAQAGVSKLSRQAYSDDDLLSMFLQLYEEGVLSLLFLKSVLCIEMYVWEDGESEPKKLYSCCVSPVNDEIVWHRQALQRMSKSRSLKDEEECDGYAVEFLSEAFLENEVKKRIDKFYVAQTMAPANTRIVSFAATASKEYDIHLLPWASVAACISDGLSDNDDLKLGRAFCSLPLPVRTGLSVQVNGYFEVSSNRRGIWYGADMDRSGKIRSVWNRLLLEDVVAPTFRQLLLGVQQFLGSTDSYYALWPSGSFEEPWSILVEHIYKKIDDAPLLHSQFAGGRWMTTAEAFLHDEGFVNSEELGEALIKLGMPIVNVPVVLFDMLLKYASGMEQRVVTPAQVRHFLRECKNLLLLSKSYKLVLLEYCLDDLVDADVGIHAKNLPLLPLADGSFGSFSEASKGVSYFICSELELMLLERLADKVIDRNIPMQILNRLSAISEASKTNLTVFDVTHFLNLLPRFVPADWRHKHKVLWLPESCSDHPTLSWFELFWQYLRDHCKKLSLFGDWPILPSTSGHLYRPSRQSKLINADKLAVSIRDALVTIGCKMLNTAYGVEHPDLSLYVCDANYAGVLEAIFDTLSSSGGVLQSLFQNLRSEERDELRSFFLDPKWHLGDCIDDSMKRNCKKLPIYKVYGTGCVQAMSYSDLENSQKYLPPLNVSDNFFGSEFIIASTTEEEILMRYYGIERMGKARFYRQQVFHNVRELQPEVRDSIMLSILQTLPQLCVEDSAFREHLRNLEFVPTCSGALKCPGVLYDPRNDELCDLLDDADNFPYGVFQEPGVLDILQSLGLRTSISLETVVESARHVERLVHEDQQKAHSRGRVLLSYLEVNAMKWSTNQLIDSQLTVNRIFSRAATVFRPHNLKSDLEKFWNDMQMICWCPVMVSAPFQTLPWPVVSSTVAPPKLVRLQADLWLVSASMRILDGECSSTALSSNLGWLSPPGGSTLAAQLLELGKNNDIVTDQVLRQELALAMPKIYSIMMSLIGTDEMDILKAILEGSRWIWVGDGFATTDEVVLDGPFHLAPYVRVIPIDLAVFKDLFLELGVRESFKTIDYANILVRMAMRKASSTLDVQEIRAVLLIVQHLAEVQFCEQEVKIYLPDISGRLFPAIDLVYNDAPWLLGSDHTDNSFGASSFDFKAKRKVWQFVHGNISNEVAEKLGVCSLRRILLAESADSMNLGLSGVAEAFGQHEALTTRLKHILEMYADGPGILFELVQNAEDAGATEVIFLLDKTQYGTSSVLSPEMADWQGPALYCFNDSVFSPQDLYAISRIGQESKLEKPFAIGRFGLGFNCVYHFTDIPAFVSGENVVMFDPHASNLPGISPSHPGLRIKFVGRKILEQFPDQFSPFLHFGCDLLNPFPGTLFRFPLRSSSIAKRSQIKKEGYAPEDVMSLFTSFSGVVSDALLFLRNVKKISLFVKEGNGCEMQLLHSVYRNNIVEPEVESGPWNDAFSIMNGSQSSGLAKDQLLKKLSKSVDGEFPHKCNKIVVTEQMASGVFSHCWITAECLAVEQANRDSVAVNENSHKSIPWACVAAYIHSVKRDGELGDILQSEGTFSSDLFHVSSASVQRRMNFEGRAFCFLPLPISTGLPAHINSYFELSSNRRDIWFGNDMAGGGKKRSEWNMYILEAVAAPAYGHVLEKISREFGPSDLFFSYWPTTTGLEPWASMVQKLYKFIAESGLRVLYTKAREGQWIAAKQVLFPDFNFHKAHELIEALAGVGLPIATVPKVLVERFMEACPSLNLLTPDLLRKLLIRRKRRFKDRNLMMLILEYCLLDLEIPIQPDSICGLALLPVANGLFATFEKNGAGERIYIARGDEYGLVKDAIPDQLVDHGIPDDVYKKLCQLADSKKTNLCFLSCDLLEKLLVKLLPLEWQFSKKVTWSPGNEGQPSLEWISLLWNYLKSYCDDLSIFSNWPILPVGDGSLLQLVPNSNVIADYDWSENLSSLLLKVGCLFVRHDLQIEHPGLKKFVQSPTAAGILNAFLAIAGTLENIEGLFVDASEAELHELRIFVLQSKWFFEQCMDDQCIDVIKHLPVFVSCKTRKLVSLSKPIKWLKPEDVWEDLMNDDFVRAESEREKVIFVRYLDIREPSKAELYTVHVLNRMSEFLSKREALAAILKDVKILIDDDVTIKSAICKTSFVLAANGNWQQPSRLYDPRRSELQKVLDSGFFPSTEFSDPEILDTLVSLGLKCTLGLTGFLDCAKSVSILQEFGNSDAMIYGRRFITCLDALAFKLSAEEKEEGHFTQPKVNLVSRSNCIEDGDIMPIESPKKDKDHLGDALDIEYLLSNLVDDKPEEEFWSEMKAIDFCPVCVDPPVQGLPWLKSDRQVASPNMVRPMSQMWMVSSAMHILDGDCGSKYLEDRLGWTVCPKINILLMQLIELSKSYDKLKPNSDTRLDFDAALQKGIPTLYSRLQEYIGTDDFMVLKSALDGVPWVWIGDDFVSSNSLAFDSPVKFSPYLYVVPSELSEFKELLLQLGVRLSFDVWDYFHVLQRLQNDVKGSPLSTDQLSFVHCILEAVSDCCPDGSLFEASNKSLLMPDSSGFLMCSGDLVYNDAPWMERSSLVGKPFVHPSISNDLANRLGVKSLRCLSLLDEEMTKDLPCMDFAKINELLALYGNNDFLLFDLLELADCCKAKRVQVIFDKREHPRQSLLQHNLSEFQGPALVVILEGVSLNREEISSLQLLPPWRLRGNTLNYGLGLLSCFFICDLLSIISGGHLYMFDPCCLALGAPSSHAPAAKMFSLIGTNLTERFCDQFNPMLIGENTSLIDCTIIRMPLSSKCVKDGLELGLNRIKQIFDRFMEHASSTLIFLKSVLQVSLSTWDEGFDQPCLNYSICVGPSSAGMRNPFSEKKWRKFQISRLFSSSNAAVKLHVIDVNLYEGATATRVIDRWLVVLSLGSGQTRNMALDRRYLVHNLTPVAGVALHISRNGHPAAIHLSSSIMSPLPLSSSINLPVVILGYFLLCHNGGRSLFKYQDRETSSEAKPSAGDQLIEAWNRELMSCVCDSYVEMVVEMQKLIKEPMSPTTESCIGHSVALSLKAYRDQIYSFWPRSYVDPLSNHHREASNSVQTEVRKADWGCVVEQVIRPFYSRVSDLPVWQLYSGSLVKAGEGMFLSQPGNGVATNLLPTTVCGFVKEHYPVFSVPWNLVTEIQAVGFTVREVKPKMVRDLLKMSSTTLSLQSVDTYVDVLEYCLSDIEFPGSSNVSGDNTLIDMVNSNSLQKPADTSNHASSSSSVHSMQNSLVSRAQSTDSSGDALELMTSLGKALFDFGRGVVEDIGNPGGPSNQRNHILDGSYANGNQKLQLVAAELRGLPCPTAANKLVRLGVAELWLGDKDQQTLMRPLTVKFVHSKLLDRTVLFDIFSNCASQSLLKLKSFSCHLLAGHMRSLFHENWVDHVMGSNIAPWFSWNDTSTSVDSGGPSYEWIKLFWKCFTGSSEDLLLFADWPLIPAFLGRPILCRVRERHLVFIPPPLIDPAHGNNVSDMSGTGSDTTGLPFDSSPESRFKLYLSAFDQTKNRYPWLFSFLNQCNVPIFDAAFIESASSCNCLPPPNLSLGKVIVAKLVAAKRAGYFAQLTSFSDSDRDELFSLFAHDFVSTGSNYGAEEIELLRCLPIYKTVKGTYSGLHGHDQCMISSNSFLKPFDEHCLHYSTETIECKLLHALGVPELKDPQILRRFGLPGFESKPQPEQDDILIYLYTNWQDLQTDSDLLEVLKESNFVRNGDELSTDLSRPKDLFDPCDTLLVSVFNGDRKKFPGERFIRDGWLRILRKLGLQTANEADVILECAKRVEFLGSQYMKSKADLDEFERDSIDEVCLEIWGLAGSVIETVISNFAVLYGNSFCNSLSKIACVPAELGFPGGGGGKRILTSYTEAILLKDWPLAWSCSPTLSRQNVVPPEFSWGALHLRSPPAFSRVLKHLQVIGRNGGEDTLAHWPTTSGVMTVDEASCAVLKYLDSVWDSFSSADVEELRRVAFLPAANGTRLVTANSLFVRLTINLSPFAFELPTSYLPFVKVLKELGLQDMLSLVAAKDLLLNLQKACGYQRLNPNEIRAVMGLLHFLCDATLQENVSDIVRWKSDVIVPDDGCRLIHARLCVYIDSHGSRYVKHIDTSRLRFVHPDLPERICIALGIKKVSDIVTEELDKGEDLQMLESINSVPLVLLREKLSNGSFQSAVWTLMNSVAGYVPTSENLPSERTTELLQFVAEKLQFVKFLHTRFILLPNSIDITLGNKNSPPGWEDGSKHRSLWFMDREKTSILVAEPPAHISVLDVIAIVVSQVLGLPIPLPIGSLFLCPEGSESAILNTLKLCSEERVQTTSNKLLGKDILPQDALQVQLHPLRPFYTGEIVAWRSQIGEKLKYGRVPDDVRPSSGQALYRFKVETAPGVVEPLLSSHIFSFKSISMANDTPTSSTENVSHAIADKRAPGGVAESSGKGKAKSRQDCKQLQYGQVSAGELVDAVQEMLSAAGINMDEEKQSTLHRMITLQEQLKESQAALLHEQAKADVAVKEADTAKAAWVCRVCLSNEVDMTFIPCGHVLCRRCSSAVSRCPFCRLEVKKTIRIFRP
ncbi:Zinc finger C3HC4 type (RING finger) family protein [Euphorbia peplus]|nr:Zinc finger C3HC4 type (RING finger) family protein [Euphorbia peplus]